MKKVKGKPHFWSQLLISMIAMLALPNVQGWQYPDTDNNVSNSAQQIQQQIRSAIALNPRASLIVPQIAVPITKKQRDFDPRFNQFVVSSPFFQHAPIRAGPFA